MGRSAARISRSSRKSPSVWSCACSIATDTRRASTFPSGPRSAGTRTFAASALASVTAFGCTGPGIPQTDSAAIPQSSSSIPTRAPLPAASTGTPRCFPIRWAETISSATSDDNAPYTPKAVVIDDAFDWERDRSASPEAARDGHLRSARQGIHEAASRDSGSDSRNVRGARASGCRASTCHRLE